VGEVRGHSGRVAAILVTGSAMAWVNGSVWWSGSNSSLERNDVVVVWV